MPGFMFVIIIGAIVGFVARILYPGPNTVHGFILTTFLGIIGAALTIGYDYYRRSLGYLPRAVFRLVANAPSRRSF